ncbi:PucR family transcriptional regulator [Bacillaceae bacterium Marseille-Q3522]|nr:PucR family transcriptional regulator [Bacillaceae bacterium Marseille-Q3522]
MRVNEVLRIPVLQGSHVIGGSGGLTREIFSVNMMDAPDIIYFLKQNEFLVTTAYHVKDQPQLLLGLVKEMAKKGCAALGIKTKRFLQEIPYEVITLADELSFPLIELPMDKSLGDIVNNTLSAILDKRTSELQLAIDSHKKFTEHIMSGKGTAALLKKVAELIDFPVVLLDPSGKLLASSHPRNIVRPAIESLPYLPHSYKEAGPVSLSVLKNRQTYAIFPFFTHEKRAGFLVVIGEILPSNHSETLTIEQAANVISFELMKENALQQHFFQIKNDFFFHFVEGAYASDSEVISRAAEFSLPNEQIYVCAAAQLDTNEYAGSYTKLQLEADAIFDFVKETLEQKVVNVDLFKKGDLAILLFSLPNNAAREAVFPLVDMLKEVQEGILRQFYRSVSFGLSNRAANFLYVKNAYKEARDSLQTGRLSGKKAFIQSYRTKDMKELLRTVPKQDLLDFYQHVLNKLALPEYDEDQTLLNTLFVFLESHCQISETAKRLYVHRNTVVYRLEKCEELLGRNLDDPETTLQVRLAMQIKTMLQL